MLPLSQKKSFFETLDLEIKRAKANESLICIEMDSNAKLGPSVITKDLHRQSDNGNRLMNVISNNDLIVVNASPVCDGSITRHRETAVGKEESILDHVIVCHAMAHYVDHMLIDEIGK